MVFTGKALEPGFQLEVIKEAIYQKEDEADKNAAAQKEDKYQEMLSEKQENEIIDSVIPDEQKKEEIKNRKKEKRIPWNWILCCGAGGAAALAVLAAGFWGVIPKLPIEIVLGSELWLWEQGHLQHGLQKRRSGNRNRPHNGIIK